MGWLSVLLSAVAAFLFYRSGHMALMILAIIAVLGNFWSLGVMHNFATEFAKRRPNYTGGFCDITRQEAKSVPDWISWTNSISNSRVSLKSTAKRLLSVRVDCRFPSA